MIECCVNLCPSNSFRARLSFYRFPMIRSDENRQASIERRAAWIQAVGKKNIDWDLAVVCGKHFYSGRPSQLHETDSVDWVPSLELNVKGQPQNATARIAAGKDEAATATAPGTILGSLLLTPTADPPAAPKSKAAQQRESQENLIRTNSKKICRLCLGKDVRLTRPFENAGGPDDDLLQRIYECTTVKVMLKNKYPAAICAICDTKLKEYSRFRDRCIENDELLRSILDDQDKNVESVEEAQDPSSEELVQSETVSTADIRPVEFHESTEIKDLQLQLYGSSDENTLSQSEFAGSDATGTVTPLPKITNVTSNASKDAVASTSNTKSPSAEKAKPSAGAKTPTPEKAPVPTVKPTISVKPLSSLAAIPASAVEPATSETVKSSPAPKEAEKSTVVPAHANTDGRHECTICSRPFRNSYTLRRHMNLHTEENLYTCEYCNKKFNDRSNWKIHLRAHTGDNLLRCAVCFKTFISPSTLKYHLRAHRKLKAFECKFCVEATSSYQALSDHLAAKHADVRLEDYAKHMEEAFAAGDFLKIEMDADETTLSAALVAGMNTESDESGSEAFPRRPPPLIPAPTTTAAAASVSVSHSSSMDEIKIKEEVPDLDDIAIKQEPVDEETLGALVGGSPGGTQQLTALIPANEEESPPVILFRCDYCMKIFKYLYELRVHMKIHNGPKPATTDSSAAKPPPPKKPRHPSIDADVAELANAPLPEHDCPKCDKAFRTEELLRVHIETHKMDLDVTKARSCKVCFKTFKCELNLVSHMRKHHEYETFVGEQQQLEAAQQESELPPVVDKPEDKPQSPDSSSNDAENQSQGESVDTAEGGGGASTTTERKCEICALSFDCAYKLEQHVMTHFKNNEAVAFVPSADRPYKCTECHKRFKRKDYLLIHIRTHTGERRHKCDMCSSAFVHPSNLITHRKLHSNERPFKCDLCPAAFKLYAGLKIHRKRCVLKYLQENSVTVT